MRNTRIAATLLLLATATSVDRLISQAGPPDQTSVEATRHALDVGRYAEAEQLAAQRVAAMQVEHGSDAAETARASDLLVEALIKNGKGSAFSTVALAERLVADKGRRFGNDSLELAISLHNLGALLTDRGEFAKAIPLHERALAIRRRSLPANDPELADSLDYLALPLIWLERFPEAQKDIGEARRVRENSPKVNSLNFAHTLYLEALLHRWDGNYESATSALNQVLQIHLDLASNHLDNVATLQLSGDLLFLKGDVREAERAWTRALTMAEQTVSSTHPILPPLFHRLAMVAQEFGDLAGKRVMLDRAMRASPGPMVPCYAELPAVMNDFGTLSNYLGEFQEARTFFGEALTKSKQCLGPTHSLTATIIHNEAVLAADMGNFAEAERLHRQALQTWSVRLGPNHPYVARGLDALAGVAMVRGRLSEANRLFERALSLRARALGGEHPDVASTLVNLARTTAAAGNVARALEQVGQAISIYRLGDRPQEPDYLAAALSLRGTLESKRGEYIRARDSFGQAFLERERVFGVDHPLTAEARANVASADFALGSDEAAVREALDAEQTGRNHLRFTIRYLPERQALAYADKRPRGLDLALSVVAAGRVSVAPSVVDSVVQSRGLVLDELAARAQSARGVDSELAALNIAAAGAREHFANLMLRSLKGEDPVPRPILDDARDKKEAAERALAEKSVAARVELARANVGLQEVRDMLPTNTVLVAFVRYDRTMFTVSGTKMVSRATASYIGFVIRSDTASVDAIPLGFASSIDSAITAWRKEAGGLTIAAGTPTVDAERAYRAAGARLRQRIWDPLASSFRGASQVFVVPDGALNLVSFAALPTGTSHYLLEDGPVIHYLSTERDLVPTDTLSSGHGLLAVGGPAFDERVQPAATASARRSGCATLGYVHFEDLPGSKNEAADIAKIWPSIGSPQDDVKLLSGRSATETAVKQAAVGRRVVHLATHGYFLQSRCDTTPLNTRGVGAITSASVPSSALSENPLLLTGLALAGANLRTSARVGQDDGILTAEEVAGLNLQGTEWAVLSACDTGAGQIKAGEGVFGLRRAFQIAGARTIIMSLWSVEDLSTRTWMRNLYDARFNKRLSTADSVREASMRVLRDRRALHQSTHPFYWAAFVAAGDWR